MANYKRVISYMYAYRNQLKGNNVGFTRIETRGNECKITLHVRVVNMKDQEVAAYIYCWYNNELHAVYLGDIHISNSVGELIVKTDVDNVMNSRYRFTDMGGILLYVSDAQYIATEWDGKAVLFDTLKIDTVKPSNFSEFRARKVEVPVQEKEEKVEKIEEIEEVEKIEEAQETQAAQLQESSQSEMQEQPIEVEAAVAVVIPEEDIEEELQTSEMEKSLDDMIEDEVAREEKEEESSAEAVKEDSQEERVLEEDSLNETNQEKEEPQSDAQEEPARVEKEQEEPVTQERSGAFPLSQEKMEHLDQQAQELFGTMLLNTLFPPDKSEEHEKEVRKQDNFDPLSEEVEEPVTMAEASQEEPEQTSVTESVLQPEQEQEEMVSDQLQASEALTINPKTAIECFTAFRSCESSEEYEEIQEEIQTMRAEIAYMERISKEWKIKEARMQEIQKEKEQAEEEARAQAQKEEEKRKIEEKIRSEYKIDGIKGELAAAELKRALTERIFNKYPRIDPFEDAAVENCVRIEPQDLGIFPMENWILANNSFLLHGYYSYRHLIFVMENEDGRYRYLLGVPGVNHSRERFMANMFGFSTFKNLSSKEDESGEFGYWCHEIIM